MLAKVSVLMGSDSDLPIMKDAIDVLTKFGIAVEVKIISAHRTPHKMFEYAQNAKDNGVSVIIAGAGGAAHVAGVIAGITSIPVIGVPIKTSTLNGLDSLYSIVQMPSGIPVATVAINGAKNAGILAAQILAVSDKELDKKIVDFKNELKAQVEQKNQNLDILGVDKYIESKNK